MDDKNQNSQPIISPIAEPATGSNPNQAEPYTYHPLQDSIICWLEFSIVILIFLGALALIICSVAWVFWGGCASICRKMEKIIVAINDNWKVGLLILIPLLFRPIRRFLDKIKRFGDFDTEQKTSSKNQEPIPNIKEKK